MTTWTPPDYTSLLARGAGRGPAYANTAKAESALQEGGYQANSNKIARPQNRPRRGAPISIPLPRPIIGGR